MIETKMNRADSGMGGDIKQCDAIELMQTLPDSYVDLLLTDIPYARVNKSSNGLRVIDKKQANKETFDLQSFAREAFRVTKGNAVIFCGKEQFSTLYGYFDDWGATTRMIVWEKTNPMPMNGRYVFLSGVECAVHFRRSKRHSTVIVSILFFDSRMAAANGIRQRSLWHYSRN